jgi:hypothetical protein
MKLSADQFKPLFTRRRLRNALWSSCTVALAQQLCGSESLYLTILGQSTNVYSQFFRVLLE